MIRKKSFLKFYGGSESKFHSIIGHEIEIRKLQHLIMAKLNVSMNQGQA